MVWLLSAKLGAVQATYMAKLEIGPQLIVRISAAYRAHFPPLIMRARVRIIPCAFRSIWCAFHSLSCAFPAAYRAQLRRYPARVGPHHTVRIPQHIVRIAQLIVRISRSISCATP